MRLPVGRENQHVCVWNRVHVPNNCAQANAIHSLYIKAYRVYSYAIIWPGVVVLANVAYDTLKNSGHTDAFTLHLPLTFFAFSHKCIL